MRYLKYVLHAVILIGVTLAAVRYLNSEDLLRALSNFDPMQALVVLIVPVVQLALKSWRFAVFLRPMGVVSEGTTMRAYAAGQPATLLPGGIAARIGLLRQANVPVPTSTVAVLFSSIFDQAVFVLALLVTALWFPAAREAALLVLGVVAAVALLLLVAPVRRGLGRLALALLGRLGFEAAAGHFAESVRRGLDRRVAVYALALSVAAFASDLLLLDASLRGSGWPLPLQLVFLAYLLPTMLGRLSALPAGGIGLAEAGIVGSLVAFGDVPAGAAAVAAAVFRGSTVFLQALYGAIVYWFFWRGEKEAALPAVDGA